MHASEFFHRSTDVSSRADVPHGADSALPVVRSGMRIAAVERDTGLSKDLLRVWERRYGFPTPERDPAGERAYPLDQVARLRVVKRLLDAGYRPGRVLQLDAADLQRLAIAAGQADDRQAQAAGAAVLGDALREQLLTTLRQHDLPALRALLQRQIAQLGVHDFVLQRAVPLNALVADAWLRGQLEAFEERAYQQQLQSLLRLAAARHADEAAEAEAEGTARPRTMRAPRVLLTTFPGEPLATGLVLAETLLTLRGCTCINLGTQLAPWDTVRAAEAYCADIVALAFQGTLSPNAVVQGLTELRSKLPPTLTLWAGGSAPVLHRRRVPGVQALATLADVPAALTRWQALQAAASLAVAS